MKCLHLFHLWVRYIERTGLLVTRDQKLTTRHSEHSRLRAGIKFRKKAYRHPGDRSTFCVILGSSFAAYVQVGLVESCIRPPRFTRHLRRVTESEGSSAAEVDRCTRCMRCTLDDARHRFPTGIRRTNRPTDGPRAGQSIANVLGQYMSQSLKLNSFMHASDALCRAGDWRSVDQPLYLECHDAVDR